MPFKHEHNGSKGTPRRYQATLEGVARREPASLETLYRETRSKIFAIAVRILRCPEAAEEVTQDVYLQVWRQAPAFDPTRGNPWAWIATIARTRSIDRFRATRKESRVDGLSDVNLDSIVASENPEKESFQSEISSQVAWALQRLNPEQRQAIDGAYFKGLSQSEMSRLWNVPLGTIKTRVRLGIRRLGDFLQGMELAGSFE